MRNRVVLVVAAAILVAACGGDGAADTTTAPAGATTTAEGPAMGPAALSAEAQTSDGSTIVIASVTLPAPGFVGVHGNADGSPGLVVGNSELLPAGESTDVTITLDQPLTESGTLFPMVHIDVNGNGEYDFSPPDVTVDGPGTTDSGEVAVIPVEVTVE